MNDPMFIGEKNKQNKDLYQIREDFPILAEQVNGKPLAYLDNAASSQMPKAVIDRVSTYHLSEHSNIHRAVHLLSERATAEYEDARIKVKDLIGARSEKEIIFTKGTTNGINMVAQGYGRKFLKAGDEILITHLEHHSNIVPWQLLCEQLGVKLKVAPIDNAGDVDIMEYEKLLSEKTKFVALSHVSNALGTVLPIRKMIRSAHGVGAPVLIDGAQAVPHMEVDVQELDCDFYVFSGHKMCGPSGIGALYGRGELLEEMHPYEGGGDMILSVSFDKTVYNSIPYKFEAGTPPIAQAIGLGRAVDYLQNIGFNRIHEHEQQLLRYATGKLKDLPGIQIIGNSQNKAGVISFVVEGIHPHDIGTLLNEEGVAIRTGHHCAQPVMEFFSIPATARASFYFYNTPAEVDQLVEAVKNAKKIFGC